MKTIVLLILAAGLLSGCGAKSRFFSDQFLKTKGTTIVNQKGDEVYLYGFNIGNWLLIEPWMLKMDNKAGIKAGKDIFDRLEKRFGTRQAMELYRTYLDNFITEQDIASIADLGMNLIRVPFWYGSLFDPKYSGRELSYLDKIIRWARGRHLYVLIDLHGAPGGQNADAASLGENVTNQMWTDPVKLDQTVKIWKKIAERYKNEKIVAGYDILNDATGAPSLPASMKDLLHFYDILYKTIREIDTNHMIFIEDGGQGIQRMPNPSLMGWENVVYSFHYYPDAADPKAYTTADAEFLPNLKRAQFYFNVPFNVGEFNSIQPSSGGVETMKRLFDVFRSYGWSWNIWSYKKIEDNEQNNWGLTGYVDSLTDIDLDSATFEIVRDLFRQFNTSYMKKNAALENAIKDFTQDVGGLKEITRIRDDLVLYPEEGEMTRGRNGSVKMEWKQPAPELGKWGENDSVSWLVLVPADGIYGVKLEYASGAKSNAVPAMEIWMDGHKAGEFTVSSTGGWDKYNNGIAAVLPITNGRHIFTITSKKSDDGYMNLRSAELVLSNSLPVTNRSDYDTIRLLPIFFYAFEPVNADVCVEWQNTPGNIGHWQNGEMVNWLFESDADASYQVSFDFASPAPYGSSRIDITANREGRVNSVRLPGTGGWTLYQKVDAGRMRFRKGMNALTLQGYTKNKEGVGALGEILLQKIK